MNQPMSKAPRYRWWRAEFGSRISAAILAVTLLAGGCGGAPTRVPDAARSTHSYQHAAVAADHPRASEAGAQMLLQGGNAVDAAVATSFTLSVVRPYSCGIGGGGFMLIVRPAEHGAPPLQIAIDYRETAPLRVGRAYFEERSSSTGPPASRYGPDAVGVPGTVAGLLYVLERYGTLDRATVLAPAIDAAENGFRADANYIAAVEELAADRQRWSELHAQSDSIWEYFCRAGAVEVGDTVTNRAQARALRLIAEQGAAGFYEGAVAQAILDALGPSASLTAEDLAGYRPLSRAPLVGAFHEWTVVSMPPPSSGGLAIQQMLGLLERRASDLDGVDHDAPQYVQLVTESMKHAFADRATWLADPAFVPVPVDELLDSAYLDHLAAEIDLRSTGPPASYGSAAAVPADAGTSHLSVIDAAGMAVACTETINLSYGSLVAVPEFGFVLNNEMDDFTAVRGEPNAFGLQQSERNQPEPGKRPLSSMSPTIVLQDGRPILIVGASGGPRIITGSLQCILNCLLFDMSADDAVEAPRFHHQWMPNTLQFEERWRDQSAIASMAERGHEVSRRPYVGKVQLVWIRDGVIEAASDSRKGGQPAGY